MKIAYITTSSPYDKHSWSGTNYYTRKSLEEQGHSVYCIYGAHSKSIWQKIKAKVLALFGYVWLPERTFEYSRKYARKIERQLHRDTDAILSLGTIAIACLKTDIPIFAYVDDIFEHYRTYYNIENITDKCIEEANRLEQKAIDNCCKIISCSKLTGEEILAHYKLDKSKLEIVPLGANLDYFPSKEEVENFILKRGREKCRILFVGVEWERKGADVVMETARKLYEMNFPIEVHLCGLRNLNMELPDYVVNHGFIAKTEKDGYDKLCELYSTSHFLFVPSIAEAYGLVFCEASAFGLPSISHKTGGLTTVVKNGVNGELFELGTSADVFADYIKKTFNDYHSYINLAKSSYERFREELNWDVAGKRLSDIMGKQCL